MARKSDLFYITAERFQSDRNAKENQLQKDLKSIEQYRGDKYYDEKAEDFRKQFEADMNTMRADAKRELSDLLTAMESNASKTPMVIPTTEQNNLLAVLGMRSSLTQNELDTAAQSMGNCVAGLKVLDEMAEKNHLMRVSNRFAPPMSCELAMDLLGGDNSIDDFLQYNTTRAARVGARYNKALFGTDTEQAKRKPFTTKEGCFRELFGLEGDAYQEFCQMVDAD